MPTTRTPARLRPAAITAALAVAAALALHTPAAAQTLNLSGPQTPQLGDDAAALALADRLRAEAEAVAAPAEAAARRLAAALLETGQREAESRRSPRGPARVLLGRTIAARLDAIDAALESRAIDPPTALIIAADLARIAARPDEDPVQIERALREALAPLADAPQRLGLPAPPHGGWIQTQPPPALATYADALAQWTAEGTPLSTPAIEALRAATALADQAGSSRAYQRAADAIHMAVLAAHDAGATQPLPRWIGPTARAAFEPALDRALATMADPGRRAQGLAELRRHGRLLALVRAADRLPDDQTGRRAREALSNFIAIPPTNRELEATLLGAYERALGLVHAARSLPDDRALVRQLRPAWREFQNTARAAADRLADVLPTLLNDSAAMSDPGIISLFSATASALDEARGLHELTALLAGQPPAGAEPVALDAHRDLAARLLTLAQAVSRSSGGDSTAARRDLAAIALDAAAWRILPAEAELRAAVAAPDRAWTTATEGREHDLLDLVDRTRAAYLANIASQGPLVERAALRARLQMIADLLVLVRDVAHTVRSLDEPAVPSESADPTAGPHAPPALAAWSGWELSRAAHRLLSEGLTDATRETISLALRSEDERARIRIAAIRRDLAPALLPARLEQAWLAVAPRAVGPLDEIALGPPDPALAWMPIPRDLLAEFCRLAEELPGIRLRRSDSQDRQVRAALAALAQDALAQLR